jgi:hypothetical protein
MHLAADRAGIFSRISGSFGHCRVLSRNRRVGVEWPTSQWPPLHPGASAGCRSLLHGGRVGAPGLFVSVKTLWLCGSHVPSLGTGGGCRHERRQAPAHSQLGPRRGADVRGGHLTNKLKLSLHLDGHRSRWPFYISTFINRPQDREKFPLDRDKTLN